MLNQTYLGLEDGIQDMTNFAIELLSGDNRRVKMKINQKRELEIANANIGFENFDGKTAVINGIEYAKNDQGQLFNTTAGYLIQDGEDIYGASEFKKINKIVDESKTIKQHFSLRGYMNVGGYVLGNVASQIIGLKGAGYATKAIKLRALATANGFASVAKYKNYANLAEAIGGTSRVGNLTKFTSMLPTSIAKPLRYIAKESTVNAVITQGFIGGYIGHNDTLKAALEAGFNNEEAEDFANEAAKDMACLLYTSPSPRD